MKICLFSPLLLVLGLLQQGLVDAADETTLQEVTVNGAVNELLGMADSASEGIVTARQLASRPLLRPAEVLESVPGMIVTQHSGDGKANQYFLRGFNLDHGSDFATHVMGMPVNMVSHAHGQGYMDLNFLIPELVAQVNYRKGVYAASDGDFSTSGSADIDYLRQMESRQINVSLGHNNYRRLLVVEGGELNSHQLLAALEVAGNDGPWEQPEALRKINGVLRLTAGTAAHGYTLSAMAYQADWRATEHVPERAIQSGEIGRYGALSANDGGKTHRYSLSGDWATSEPEGSRKSSLYVIDYGLNLFSAPSGFINGAPGDQHEQADARTIFGGQSHRSWLLGPAWNNSELTAGVQLRHDRIGTLGLYNTENRRRTGIVREDRVNETALGVLLEFRTQWNDWLRSTVGVRRDQIRATSSALSGAFNMSNGGTASAGQSSPKLGLVLAPRSGFGQTEFYANWGDGFHSNDARGATARTNPQNGNPAKAVPLIVKARGSEIGLRSAPLAGWNSRLSLWQMRLDSELVFIGDEGVTEPKGASRRHGVEWSNDVSWSTGWRLDADVAWSQARFIEANPSNGGYSVPNAIPLTLSLGLSADHGGPWFGGLRLRYIGAYALEETAEHKSTPFWMANLKAGYRFSRQVQLSVDVLNLFNRQANDIEYWGSSCTRNESLAGSCGGGIDGRLVHPLEPRSLRLGLRIGF